MDWIFTVGGLAALVLTLLGLLARMAGERGTGMPGRDRGRHPRRRGNPAPAVAAFRPP